MKIETSNSRYYRLSSIAEGNTFYYKDELYIKTNVTGVDADIRAIVRLRDGKLKHLVDEDFVIPADAKVIVE